MLKDIKNLSKYLEDIIYMGDFVFKIRKEGIAYARGLLKMQISGVVKIELEGESLFGIANYLDNERELKRNILSKTKKVLNRLKLKKKIFRRYYNVSNKVLGKVSIVEVAGKVVNVTCETISYIGNSFFMTKQNLNKIVSEQKLNNNFIDDEGLVEFKHKKIMEHRVSVEGINMDNDKINLEVFSTFTSKPKHDIDLMLSEEEIELTIKGIELKIPTLKVAGNDGIKVMDNYSIKNMSIEKKIMPLVMEIKQKDVIEMPKGLGQTIREKKERMMEKLGWKDYEFFQNKGLLYGVHKEDIEKIGNIIVHVKFEKARPVTLGDYAKMSKEIANNPELNEFMNIDMKTKVMYENNYKIWSDLKKD